MRKSSIIFLFFLVLAAGFFTAFMFSGKFESSPADIPTGIQVGQKAPDFQLKNISGDIVRLTDYRGKRVFLNFWATWCPPCRMELPDIQKLNEEREDIIILGINSGESKLKVETFLNINEYTFPVLLDQKGEISEKYGIRGIPTTLVIDEEGVILARHTGYLSYNQMLKLLGQSQ